MKMFVYYEFGSFHDGIYASDYLLQKSDVPFILVYYALPIPLIDIQ